MVNSSWIARGGTPVIFSKCFGKAWNAILYQYVVLKNRYEPS